jgi:DNA repair photolyase
MGACVDFWCDAAKMHDLGRRSLEAILSHEDWSVQILTKNAAIEKDFDILKKNSRRVRIGLNITAPASKTAVMSVVEPNASANPERMTTLWKAHKLGLSTYVMVGPLLPRIGDSEACIDELVGTAAECGVDVILAKPLNARGLALRRTQKALAKAGYAQEAAAIESIKTRKGWSRYAAEMACNFQRSCLKLYQTGCLRFFLRQSRLVEDDISRLEMNDHGIEWIGGRRKRYGEVR